MTKFISELEASLVGCPKGSLKGETRFREQPWWDSLAALIILASFQNTFGKQLNPLDLRKCETLAEVAKLAD
jgi:acyl carrier protein